MSTPADGGEQTRPQVILRVRRTFLIATVAVSGLLLGITTTLWIDSYFYLFNASYSGKSTYSLFSSWGTANIGWIPGDKLPPRGRSWHATFHKYEPVRSNHWFDYSSGKTSRTPTRTIHVVTIPYWALFLPALLGVVYPIRRLRSMRRISRADRELCPNCGYDLRASPERCPECGTKRPI